MYSSEDLERFYFQYQTEALPHGESLHRFVLRTKFLITSFRNGTGIPEKVVEGGQVDGAPVIGHEEQSVPLINLNGYHQAKLITLFVFGLRFVSTNSSICSKEFKLPDLVRNGRETGGLC